LTVPVRGDALRDYLVAFGHRDRIGGLIHEYSQVALGDVIFGTHGVIAGSAGRLAQRADLAIVRLGQVQPIRQSHASVREIKASA
jgi:hypothetical protein